MSASLGSFVWSSLLLLLGEQHRQESYARHGFGPHSFATIHRTSLLQDGFEQLNRLGDAIKVSSRCRAWPRRRSCLESRYACSSFSHPCAFCGTDPDDVALQPWGCMGPQHELCFHALLLDAQHAVFIRSKRHGRRINCTLHSLQGQVRIKFVDEHGIEEAGIDGGGLFKDFMEHLVREVRVLLCPDSTIAASRNHSVSCVGYSGRRSPYCDPEAPAVDIATLFNLYKAAKDCVA